MHLKGLRVSADGNRPGRQYDPTGPPELPAHRLTQSMDAE